jgi:hypothetical protein
VLQRIFARISKEKRCIQEIQGNFHEVKPLATNPIELGCREAIQGTLGSKCPILEKIH